MMFFFQLCISNITGTSQFFLLPSIPKSISAEAHQLAYQIIAEAYLLFARSFTLRKMV